MLFKANHVTTLASYILMAYFCAFVGHRKITDDDAMRRTWLFRAFHCWHDLILLTANGCNGNKLERIYHFTTNLKVKMSKNVCESVYSLVCVEKYCLWHVDYTVHMMYLHIQNYDGWKNVIASDHKTLFCKGYRQMMIWTVANGCDSPGDCSSIYFKIGAYCACKKCLDF